MDDIGSLLWVIMLAGWVGALIGQRAERKLHNPKHEEFVLEFVKAAKSLKRTRLYVGEGPRVIHECKWSVHGVGHFDITIAESILTENDG